MDVNTRNFYEELTARQAQLRWSCFPQWTADFTALHGVNFATNSNYVNLVNSYEGMYSEWYRCIAYMRFGYGNLSNNDRARHGLKPIRKRRKGANA